MERPVLEPINIAEDDQALSRANRGDGEPIPAGDENARVSLLDLLIILAHGKWIWIGCGVVCCIVAAILGQLLPVQYQAETDILPPQQSTSSASILMGEVGNVLGMGGNAGIGLKDPNDLILAILKSRTVAGALVEEFDLRKVYKRSDPVIAGLELGKHSKIETTLEGVISIKVEDRDPKRAAAIANGYVEQLYKQNERLATTEAGQRRLFFEHQLAQEKDALADAEVALKQVQLKTGVIELQGQTAQTLRSVADLRAAISNREVTLRSLLNSETPENPDIVNLKEQIRTLREQLGQMESSNLKMAGDDNGKLTTSAVPVVALDYVRKEREVRYHETLFNLLARQFEAAKIDESKEAPAVQVIDTATPPHFEHWPPRRLIIVASTATGVFLGCIFVVLREVVRRTMLEQEYSSKYQSLRRAIRS